MCTSGGFSQSVPERNRHRTSELNSRLYLTCSIQHTHTHTHLFSGESRTHGADGLCVVLALLFDLQKLSRLNQRLQRLTRSTALKIFIQQPFLQLTYIIPYKKKTIINIEIKKMCIQNSINSFFFFTEIMELYRILIIYKKLKIYNFV